MPKVNIYVPDEMKARMDKAEESANWSALAQRAFESELNHLESVKEVKSMNDVIERLCASKQRNAQELQKEGRECGVDWAKYRAEYDELKRVSQIDTTNLHQAYIDDPDSVNRNWVAKNILADLEWEALGWQDQSSAIAELFGVDEDMLEAVVTTEFVEGFIGGAADVWNEIKDQL